MVKILHLSDIHMGSGFSYERINPETWLNTRFEDFTQVLKRCVDSVIAPDILEAAQGLLTEDPYGDKAIIAPEDDPEGGLETVEDDARQLRLL